MDNAQAGLKDKSPTFMKPLGWEHAEDPFRRPGRGCY